MGQATEFEHVPVSLWITQIGLLGFFFKGGSHKKGERHGQTGK